MYAIVFLSSTDVFEGAEFGNMPAGWDPKSQNISANQIYNQFCISGGEQVYTIPWEKVTQYDTVRSIDQKGITVIQTKVVVDGWMATSRNAAVVEVVGNNAVFLQELSKCEGDHESIQALLSQPDMTYRLRDGLHRCAIQQVRYSMTIVGLYCVPTFGTLPTYDQHSSHIQPLYEMSPYANAMF